MDVFQIEGIEVHGHDQERRWPDLGRRRRDEPGLGRRGLGALALIILCAHPVILAPVVILSGAKDLPHHPDRLGDVLLRST